MVLPETKPHYILRKSDRGHNGMLVSRYTPSHTKQELTSNIMKEFNGYYQNNKRS